jgi:hypothetical protein
MVAFAEERLNGAGEVVRADMADFDLGRRFGGAVSVVSTVGVLRAGAFASHLEAMARHLEPGARYLVQQAIGAEPWRSEWEAERDGVRLHVVWETVERERSRSRVEIVSGPRAGEVVEDLHASTHWSIGAWQETVAASPLVQIGCYDGGLPGRPGVALEDGGRLLWHELAA